MVKERRRRRRKITDLPPLPTLSRLLVLVLGWLLIGIGLAGLVLPGIQGVVTLIAGAALVSLVSRTMLRIVRWCFRPWPRGWRKLLKMRRRLNRWFRGEKRANSSAEENRATRAGAGQSSCD